jgi:phage baseplate assembly protein W
MPRTLHPAVLLGAHRPDLRPTQALATRIRMVLETRPGSVPFRPDFGCDLSVFAGQPATSQLLEQVQAQIEASLTRQIPDLKVRSCTVTAVTDLGTRPGTLRQVPIAEAALVRLGVQATLEVQLEVTSPAGSLSLSATLAP